MTSLDWLENFHSFFSSSFPLAKESETFSWQLLQSFSPVIFEFLVQSWLVFVKMIRNDQIPNVVLTPSIYKTLWEEIKTKNFLASNKFYVMFNSVFSQKWWCVKWIATTALKAKTWSSNRSNWTKYKRGIVSAQNESHASFGTKYSRVDQVKSVEDSL